MMVKKFLLASATCLAAWALSMSAQADPYPSKPVTIVSPVPVGGSVEAATRAWMQCASSNTRAGQPFVLLNKPGANGVIAAQAIRSLPNDGYSLLFSNMSLSTITPFVFKKMPYDPEKDFEGGAIFAISTLTMVASADSGIKSMDDLVTYAKARPGGVSIGIPAIATPAHLLSAAVAAKLGIEATLVPMSGGEAAGVTAILGNHVPVMIFLTGTIAQYIDSGKALPLMNFTEARLPAMPKVPTVVEVLHDSGFARGAWIGMAAKAGGPPEVVAAIDRWTKSCLDQPDFQQALKSAQFSPYYVGAHDYANVVRRDMAFWRPWIDRLGIKND